MLRRKNGIFIPRIFIYHQVDVRKIKSIKYKLLMNSSYRRKLTVGTGMLIHKGPWTVEELKKTYDPSTLQESYKSRLQEAQNYVIHYVRD